MQPVRGTPSAEVEQNQRERLFAAMVANVAKQGFAATTVADLVETSGVSSRSFYDLFGDKATCLRATVEEILAWLGRELARDEVEDSDLEGLVRSRYDALAKTAITQPAAVKVCLTDFLAAGPDAFAPLERAVEMIEQEVQRRIAGSPDRAEMPPQMIAARAGGVIEVVRARLRSGREDELPGLREDIVGLLLSDRPPPEPLRFGFRRRKTSSEGLDAPDPAERAIRAFAVLVAEQGYPKTTVDEVVTRASMSARTFYANFKGKEDLMMAAIDGACAQAVAAVMPAFSRQSKWPAGVHAGYEAMLNQLASRPALARLAIVDLYAAGDDAIERQVKGLAPLGALLANNTVGWQDLPAIGYESIAGGIRWLLYTTVNESGIDALPGLAPICTYLTLSPFIGPEAACAAANREELAGSQVRAPSGGWAVPGGVGPSLPFNRQMGLSLAKALAFIEQRAATAAEVAVAVDEDPAVVSEYLRRLGSVGALEVDPGADGEPRYRAPADATRHKHSILTTQQTAMLSEEEQKELSELTWRLIVSDTELSLRSGLFGARLDHSLSRTPLRVDEAGWRELAALHWYTLYSGIEIQARSTKRLEETGEKPIHARSMQLAFEVPEPTEDENP